MNKKIHQLFLLEVPCNTEVNLFFFFLFFFVVLQQKRNNWHSKTWIILEFS